jgi:ABC-type transport system involved in cytochrome c biogenesis permease component
MTFLPIVERELRIAARRASTFWVRFFVAAGVLGLGLFIAAAGDQSRPEKVSKEFFVAMGVLGLIFGTLSGIFLTAECLSEEKREGTLGLLFLTDLKGYDIVLGKLAATSLHALYGLFAMVPLLWLPLLVGGVTGGEIARVALVLLTTLLLSLSIGLFSSVLSREARHSMGGTIFALLLFAGLLPALWWVQRVTINQSWASILLWPSPVYAYITALDSPYRFGAGPVQFWGAVTVLAGLGLAFLIAAGIYLPRVWRRENGPEVSGTCPLPALSDRTPFAGLLEINPFLWLTSALLARAKHPRFVMGSLVALFLFFLAAALSGSNQWREAVIACFFISYSLHQVVKLLIAIESTRQFSEDKKSGALELLLVTPQREQAILTGHFEALRQRFRPLSRLLAGVNLAMVTAIIVCDDRLHMSGTDQLAFVEIYLGGLLILPLDMRALMKVGARTALRTRKQQLAALKTVATVMLPPWLGIFCLTFLLQGLRLQAVGLMFVFGCWFMMGVVTDWIALARVKADFKHGLRFLITEAERKPA